MTTDCEKAFHDIRLNHTEEIYIELHFKDQELHAQYLAVLEDNPYLPETKERKQRFETEADVVLTESIRQFQLKKINEEINQALDAHDKDAFLALTEKLNHLLKKLLKQSPKALFFWYTRKEEGSGQMRFRTEDTDTYLQSRDYVDTAIVPLVKVSLTADIKSTIQATEFTTILSEEMERQFRGRVMLFPPFSYHDTESAEGKKRADTPLADRIRGRWIQLHDFANIRCELEAG